MNMNKIILTSLAILAMATSAMAKIGETPEQVIARSKRDKDIIKIGWDNAQAKPTLEVNYRDGASVSHVFGSNGRQIAMYSYMPKRFSAEDVVAIQRLYKTTWRGTGTEGGVFKWESASRLLMAAARYEDSDCLLIWDLGKMTEIAEFEARVPQQNTKTATKPAVAEDTKDCLIVATETLARLKASAYWSKIAAFTWTDDKETAGHAAVFYQPTQDSNVFMYDKTLGSLDLHTQSHDLIQLTMALNQIFRSASMRVQSPRWIGGN